MTAIEETHDRTIADLLRDLGDVQPGRVRLHPLPGTATEQDLLARNARGPLCELVDGTLVEKPMGFRESVIASALIRILGQFVVGGNLGLVTAPDGSVRLYQGIVRLPDVAYVSWGRLPEGRVPQEAIPDLAPDLVIEVLSSGNSPGEMARKRREYFAAGVRLAWEIDPRKRTASVYLGPDEPVAVLSEADRLEGGDVLPGFVLPLAELFAELDRRAGPPSP